MPAVQIFFNKMISKKGDDVLFSNLCLSYSHPIMNKFFHSQNQNSSEAGFHSEDFPRLMKANRKKKNQDISKSQPHSFS